MGLDAWKDIADPKINPLASIEIIASEFFITLLDDILKINSLKTSGSWIIPRMSLKAMPFLGKS